MASELQSGLLSLERQSGDIEQPTSGSRIWADAGALWETTEGGLKRPLSQHLFPEYAQLFADEFNIINASDSQAALTYPHISYSNSHPYGLYTFMRGHSSNALHLRSGAVLAAGDYDIIMLALKTSLSGIVKFEINGTQVITWDLYVLGSNAIALFSTTHSFSKNGWQQFDFKCDTRHASSANYNIHITHLVLRKQ